MSKVISDMESDLEKNDYGIKLNYESSIIKLCLRFCDMYYYEQFLKESEWDFPDWCEELFTDVKNTFELLKLADFLNIESLIEIISKYIIKKIRNPRILIDLQPNHTEEERTFFSVAHIWNK